jgi:hypothetical protein
MSTVTIPDNFVVEQLKVENRGSSTFKADNLNVKSLKIETKGAGNVTVAGNSELCDFTMDGVGSIKADNLVADSVYAEVKGVGSIVCFPVLFLHGKMLGVGKLTYKNEPRTKTLTMIGLGKVGKE